MDNQDLTILSVEELNNSEALKKYGGGAANTDLCLLTGGLTSDKYVSDDKTLSGRTGFFWTRTKHSDKEYRDVFGNGFISFSPKEWDCRSIRPVFHSSTMISNLSPFKTKGYNNVDEVEYGEYPQEAPTFLMQKILESEYKKGMKKTGRSYTFNSEKDNNYHSDLAPITYDEYEYNKKRYIRFNIDKKFGYSSEKLSNGHKYKIGDVVWIEISPVKWLIDDEKNMLISKKGLVSGIKMTKQDNIVNDFNETEVQQFINKYLVHDLVQNPIFVKPHEMTPIEKKETKEELENIKKIQKEKLILAKQKLEEAAKLFNELQPSTNYNKIKIDNLRDLVFKNNGNPTENGFIEFEDFFKDNEILKIIDLSDLDLENVDITNMDFSNTNIHIDPQTIYNKDMTGVNATDVHFSPFLDSFDDVILDGAKINDKEILIDLDRLKSYNDETIIESDILSQNNKL